MGKCMLYKYVYNDRIIYIGKSDANIMNRIKAHKTEDKFLPYINSISIFCADCKNPAHTTILETYLINKYKPELNKSMKYNDELNIKIDEPDWMELSYYNKSKVATDIIKMPEKVRKSTKLTASDILVLAALMAFSDDEGKIIISYQEISDYYGDGLVSGRTPLRSINRLEANGFIKSIRHKGEKSQYQLLISQR